MKFTLKEKIILLLVGLVILAVVYRFVYYPIIRNYYFSKETRYTITTRHEFSPAASHRGADQFLYFFSLKNKEYQGLTEQKLEENKSYFVRFYPPNPKYNKITDIEATSEDLKSLPKDGYIELPHSENK